MTLHNCQAELTVKIPDRDNPKRYPSDEAKPLGWGRYPQILHDLTPVRNIQGQGSQLLHVLFSDSDFVNRDFNSEKSYIDGMEMDPKRFASISTIDRLKETNRDVRHFAENLRVEDSFTNGEFVIEITITSDEGPFPKARFLINVDTEWTNLTMRKISRLHSLRTW